MSPLRARVLACCLALGGLAAAEPRPPPPPGFEGKPPLSDDDYAKKKERTYFTGLPLANYDPSTGYGGGARVYFFQNGERKDPLFGYTPYAHRVFAQVFASTEGVQFHWLDYDAPALFGTPYRVRAGFIFERQTKRFYFGTGERTLAPLRLPDGRAFTSYPAYERAEREVRADGTTLAAYDRHFFQRPALLLSLERSLLGGAVRPLVGFNFTHATVRDVAGDRVGATDSLGRTVRAISAPTRLTEDCAAAKIRGCGGGWDNGLRLALSVDTRDYEPDPTRGVFVDLTTDVYTRALGSDYDYVRSMAAVRAFVSPAPRLARVVLAGRAVLVGQSRDAPFFSMDLFPFTEDTRIGLGGVRTIRGFKQDRFVGPIMALGNLEVRARVVDFRVASERFAVIFVPFVDVGRPFDEASRLTTARWKRGQGAGVRTAWNLATIIAVDYAVSDEDSGLYINFNHIF